MRTARRSGRWWWLLLGAVLLLFLVSIVRTVRSPSPALARAADVAHARRSVAPRSGEDLRGPQPPAGRMVSGNGVVEPEGEVVRVAGAAPGRLLRLPVRAGDRVSAGQLMAQLEDAAERADLTAAEAELSLSRAEADRVRLGSREEERRAARAAAQRAASQAALSRGIFERTRRLHGTATVSLDQLERARRAAEADEQAHRQAEAERDRVLGGARAEERRAAEARVAAARARLERARVLVAQRRVVAPRDGEVLRVSYREGEHYTPGEGQPILELGDTRRLRVRMEVDERDLGRLVLGAKGYLEAPAYPARRFGVTVVELGRRMGRKQIATGDLSERSDVKVLEVLLAVEAGAPLVVGQRVIAFVSPR